MKVTDYQKIIKKTAIYPPELDVVYPVLGLAEEAGEVAGKIKKALRSGKLKLKWDQKNGCNFEWTGTKLEYTEFILALEKELGDVQWYITAISNAFGLTLEQVMMTNYHKLLKRRETGTLDGEGDDREDYLYSHLDL